MYLPIVDPHRVELHGLDFATVELTITITLKRPPNHRVAATPFDS